VNVVKKFLASLYFGTLVFSLGTSTALANTADPGTYYIFANNDLGIHCACPADELMTMLPPWNTVRAQVLRVDGKTKEVVTDPAKITVEYVVPFAQNNLDDPRYQAYLDNINKTYPTAEGFAAVSRSNPVSIAGTPLSGGPFHPKPEHNMWVAEGIPVFPPVADQSWEGTFVDAFGTERQAFPAIIVRVKDTGTGQILAERTDVTTPVAFANCCTCHREIYKDNHGFYGQPMDVFRETMIVAHDLKHGTDLDTLVSRGQVIRCSRCHSDPAVGGATPGYPVSLYPEAQGLNLPMPPATLTLSYVIHQGHNLKSDFHVRWQNLGFSEACEACHPGQDTVGCLRGVHVTNLEDGTTMNMTCTECHGNLDARNATGQLQDPWSYRTLPRCSNCHANRGGIEWTTEQIDAYGHQQFGGAFLNSRGHKNDQLLCTSCHGAPHALAPSNLFIEQGFYSDFNNGVNRAIGRCGVCHSSNKAWGEPPH
jgi:hypothetical protein